MNILITGISGFLGRNVVSCLGDFKIFGVVRDTNSPDNFKGYSNVSLTSWDKLEYFDENIEAVLHCAGKAHDLKNTARPEDYYHVNYELTKGLYDSF